MKLRNVLKWAPALLALALAFAGCDAGTIPDTITLNEVGGGGGGSIGSGHYYVDLVPDAGIPIVDDLNNGAWELPGNSSDTAYVLAEAFNKYDQIYFVGTGHGAGVNVAVPPGKTLYVAPGSQVTGFDVASAVANGHEPRALGLDTNKGPGKLVVLNGATIALGSSAALGGELYVNHGGHITGTTVGITGTGKVSVGGRIALTSGTITVAGEVYVARGNGSNTATGDGIIAANIDTTYQTIKPAYSGDFLDFENISKDADASRKVTVDGAVLGSIWSGGDVYVAANDEVTILNTSYGYVSGSYINAYGKVDVLGRVAGSAIAARNDVNVGDTTPGPISDTSKDLQRHLATATGTIYTRFGTVNLAARVTTGGITAYETSVTVPATAYVNGGINTYVSNNGATYTWKTDYDKVNRGDVTVYGYVTGNVQAGGAFLVDEYTYHSDNFYAYYATGQFTHPSSWVIGHVGTNTGSSITARRGITVTGLVTGSVSNSGYNFDYAPGTNTDIIVTGYVGDDATAGANAVIGYAVGDTAIDGGIVVGDLSGSDVTITGFVGGNVTSYGDLVFGTGTADTDGYISQSLVSTGNTSLLWPTTGYNGQYHKKGLIGGRLAVYGSTPTTLNGAVLDGLYVSNNAAVTIPAYQHNTYADNPGTYYGYNSSYSTDKIVGYVKGAVEVYAYGSGSGQHGALTINGYVDATGNPGGGIDFTVYQYATVGIAATAQIDLDALSDFEYAYSAITPTDVAYAITNGTHALATGVTVASGARLYTTTPIAPLSNSLISEPTARTQFATIAESSFIHTHVTDDNLSYTGYALGTPTTATLTIPPDNAVKLTGTIAFDYTLTVNGYLYTDNYGWGGNVLTLNATKNITVAARTGQPTTDTGAKYSSDWYALERGIVNFAPSSFTTTGNYVLTNATYGATGNPVEFDGYNGTITLTGGTAATLTTGGGIVLSKNTVTEQPVFTFDGIFDAGDFTGDVELDQYSSIAVTTSKGIILGYNDTLEFAGGATLTGLTGNALQYAAPSGGFSVDDVWGLGTNSNYARTSTSGRTHGHLASNNPFVASGAVTFTNDYYDSSSADVIIKAGSASVLQSD
jgi:hypothetical protein